MGSEPAKGKTTPEAPPRHLRHSEHSAAGAGFSLCSVARRGPPANMPSQVEVWVAALNCINLIEAHSHTLSSFQTDQTLEGTSIAVVYGTDYSLVMGQPELY